MEVTVNKELAQKCLQKARAAVSNNTRKKYRDKYSKGVQSAAHNLETMTAGFLAEAAVCIYLGLNPDNELTWRADRPDGGYDIRVGGTTIDVKATTNHFASRLMWPVTKMDKLAQAADIFVLALVARVPAPDGSRTVRFLGWTTKSEFIAQHFKAARIHGVVDGTPYMNEKSLYSIEQIGQHLGHVEATQGAL